MDQEARQRLSNILIEMRGPRSIQGYAKDIGISFAALRAWEQCLSVPSLENLELLASLRNQSLFDLLAEIRGEEPSQVRIPPSKAEDVYSEVKSLPTVEQFRLIKLLIDSLIQDGQVPVYYE